MEVNYIFGKEGIGKTPFVEQKHGSENVYRVTNYKRDPFFSYYNEDVIVFEEFRSSLEIGEMLNYLDGNYCELPARYSDKVAVYTKVYILTNEPLYKQYPNMQTVKRDEAWKPFLKRITNVYDFDKSKIEPINKHFAACKPASEKEAEQINFLFKNRRF
ncbi:MAG: RNA helicase domain-containing protein [Firmicutes bacterium]|nr:RNA helicase domain-containing protein [Bacillota bacterium]